MIPLGIVALAPLAANGSRQLRYSAVALLGVSLAANVVTAGQLTVSQLAVEGCGALVACGILYVAARDRTYGEDPGWRLWLATIVAAAATAACFATLRTASSETVSVPLIGEDPSGVTAQVAAFWLISSGVAILVTAQTPVRGSLGAILMITGVELLVPTPPAGGVRPLVPQLRSSGLGRLARGVTLAPLFLLVLDVWGDGPAYNFFPTALAVGATSLGVLVLTAPLAIFGLLVLGLLVPVGSFTFQVQRNRSVEAATRHFGFVALGGCLGIASLALAASLPHDQPANTFVLLVVVLVVAFALLLAAIPFHTHAALLAGEVPPAALALYFGVLVPTTFIAFVEILTLSGLLPAIVQVVKVQDLLHGIGLTSAVGGAFLASGAPDQRRLVVYSVISNLGAALVGIATLSGPGIIGALASVIVTGASASGQLLAAGTLERRSSPERPIARKAPLAALAFVVGGFAMIGAPPLLGFPGRFFMELIAYQFAPLTGAALVLATLLLIVGQLRAVLALFGQGVERWVVEPRPVAGMVGAVIFVALLIGGIQPDGFLRPIASFADEFLRALRPL